MDNLKDEVNLEGKNNEKAISFEEAMAYDTNESRERRKKDISGVSREEIIEYYTSKIEQTDEIKRSLQDNYEKEKVSVSKLRNMLERLTSMSHVVIDFLGKVKNNVIGRKLFFKDNKALTDSKTPKVPDSKPKEKDDEER